VGVQVVAARRILLPCVDQLIKKYSIVWLRPSDDYSVVVRVREQDSRTSEFLLSSGKSDRSDLDVDLRQVSQNHPELACRLPLKHPGFCVCGEFRWLEVCYIWPC
jgi:hypothetical protein